MMSMTDPSVTLGFSPLAACSVAQLSVYIAALAGATSHAKASAYASALYDDATPGRLIHNTSPVISTTTPAHLAVSGS